MTSSRRGEASQDAERPHEPSAFTRHLVEALRTGVDRDHDGYVSVNEVYDYVLEKLHEETKQIPQRHFDRGAVGDLALARASIARPEPAAAPMHERPKLAISPELIELRDVGADDELPVEIVDVFNEGGGVLQWTANSTVEWIEVKRYEGYCELILRPKRGMNRGSVHIRDTRGGGSRTVRVLVEVRPQQVAPQLDVLPAELDFGVLTRGSETPLRTLLIVNKGEGELNAKALSTNPAIQVNQAEDIVSVSIDTNTPGTIVGEVIVRTDVDVRIVPIRAVVRSGPIIHVTPDLVDFARATADDRKSATVSVENRGFGQLEWTYGSTGEFFDIVREHDSLVLTLRARPGTHVGSVSIRSNGGDATVDVRAEIASAHGASSGEDATTETATTAESEVLADPARQLDEQDRESSSAPTLETARAALVHLLEGRVRQLRHEERADRPARDTEPASSTALPDERLTEPRGAASAGLDEEIRAQLLKAVDDWETELRTVPRVLRQDERPLKVATAKSPHDVNGLLVLTSARLIFVSGDRLVKSVSVSINEIADLTAIGSSLGWIWHGGKLEVTLKAERKNVGRRIVFTGAWPRASVEGMVTRFRHWK